MTRLPLTLTRHAFSRLRIVRITVAAISLLAASLLVLAALLTPASVHEHNEHSYNFIATPKLERAEKPCARTPLAEASSPTSMPLAALRRAWLGVSVSPEQSILALWTESELFVSTDSGIRAEPIAIDGTILATTVDARGRVWLLNATAKGTRLRAFEDAKLVADHAVPMTLAGSVEAFGARGDAIILVAFADHAPASEDAAYEPEMHIFAPGNATWTAHSLPSWGNAGNSIVVAQDGSIDHMGGSEASCGGGYQYHYRSSLGSDEWQEVAWPMDAPFGFVIGSEGWSYAIDESCIEEQGDTYQSTLCGTDPEGKLHRVMGAEVSDQLGDAFVTASNGKVQLALIGGNLVSLDGKILARLASLPAPGLALAVDHKGDALVMSTDHLWRWSHDGGWQALAPRLAAQD